MFLSSILHEFMDELFPGMEVKGSYQFRVTRNSELFVDEEEVENLALALRDELRGRGYAKPVRLEVADNCPKSVADLLVQNFQLAEQDVYRCDGPVNVSRITAIYDQVDRPDLKFPPFVPSVLATVTDGDNLFDAIRKRDILLHHPFESFGAVLELVRQASMDPDVLAIKQTLYRVGNDSPLVDQLIEAARQGKDVTVVVELRARFDEEANLRLANRLQEAGVQVVYGIVGYKTARENAADRAARERSTEAVRASFDRQLSPDHLAHLYGFGLMTANPDIGEDAHLLFLQLSGLGPIIQLKCLLHSPFTLHKGLMEKIEREITHAQAGKPARIIAKMNALNEESVVEVLYRASRAGVSIDLIIRGACTLRPGIPGVSDNIRVRSIVGRFLEHSRVYWFRTTTRPRFIVRARTGWSGTFCAASRRAFRSSSRSLPRACSAESLENYLEDNTQAWQLGADGSYLRLTPGDAKPHSAQQALLSKYAS